MSKLEFLEDLYVKYNSPSWIHPDPLEKLVQAKQKNYSLENLEIVALISSSLAMGRVEQILLAIDRVLEPLGDDPVNFIDRQGLNGLLLIYQNFKYRFFTGKEISSFLISIRDIQKKHQNINNYFKSVGAIDYISKLEMFTEQVNRGSAHPLKNFFPLISKGSSCKRIMMLFRWMIRKDDVDLGLWDFCKPSELIVPVDVHMFKSAKLLGFLDKNTKMANLKTAIKISNSFKEINAQDPIKYDFCLTRVGINPLLSYAQIWGDNY